MSAVHAPGRRTLPIRRLGAPLRALPPRPFALDAPNATLAWRDDLTATVARFGIRPDDPVPAFEPGQYLSLGLPVDDRLVLRPYSAASTSPDGEIELLVRLVSGGALTPRLWRLASGARLRLGRPKGLFRLEPADDRTHLFLATGTGIAPLVAMAAALRARGPRMPPTVIVHGVREPAELAYADRLARWQAAGRRLTYVPVVSGSDPAWRGRRGRIDAALPSIAEAVGLDPRATVAYICGSPGTIDSVGAVLRGLGLPDDAVRAERYWTASTSSVADVPTER